MMHCIPTVLPIALQVDKFVARQQRRQLGLCEECGGLYEAATCQQQGCPSRRQ